MTNTLDQLHHEAQSIFDQALDACDIDQAFHRMLRLEGKVLHVVGGGKPEPLSPEPLSYDLRKYKRVLVIAFGKAAPAMLDALMRKIPDGMDVRGLCTGAEEPKVRYRHIKYFDGGHPLPNRESIAAGEEALHLLQKAKKDTLVIFLISGGGSAMLEAPLDKSISLVDTAAFHETLVECGATITEVNTVRKFYSSVKAGRLAEAAPQCDQLSLLLADVPLRELEAIASSPTLPNHTTFVECEEILTRYKLMEVFPVSVRSFFEKLKEGKLPLPPATTHPAFRRSQFRVLLSNRDFIEAAARAAREMGYEVTVDNTCDDWDYRNASQYLLDRFRELRTQSARTCLLSSGEVTVKLPAEHGCGGRNQHLALVCAFDLALEAGRPMVVLSAGSDGIDGSSHAAGAIVDTTTLERARQQNFDPEAILHEFDSCPMFTAIGDCIVTGPTGNNLRDLRVFLSDAQAESSEKQAALDQNLTSA